MKSSIHSGGESVESGNTAMVYTIGEINVREVVSNNFRISEGFIGPGLVTSLITCPEDITIKCGESTEPANTGLATAIDRCDPDADITYSDEFVSLCGNSGIINRTWITSDNCDHYNSCVQMITIEDNTAPLITCPQEVWLELDNDTSPAAVGIPEAIDNCGGEIVPIHTDEILPGTCPVKYTIKRTWTATDVCGNTSTFVHRINIVDTTEPTFTAIPTSTIYQDNDQAQCGAIVMYPEIVAVDNSLGYVDITTDPFTGSYFDVGITTVTVTAKDECNNIATAYFNVELTDTELPEIMVASESMTLWPADRKYHTINIADFILSVNDNCPIFPPGELMISQVSSDEPDNSKKDADIVISQDCQSVDLLADRLGRGNGRVYTISVAASDENGNTGLAEYQVYVPKSKKKMAVDDGAIYTADVCGNTNTRIAEAGTINIDLSTFGEISVYPNPVREIVTIEFPADFVINNESIGLHLFNLIGVDMMNNHMKELKDNILELDIMDLPAGIYILTIPAGESIVKHKITKL